MNNLDQDQNLKPFEQSSAFLIHFRCPDCSKLYSSNPENIYIENPDYTCTACDTEFTVSLIQALENPEVVGVKKQKPPVSETLDLPEIEAPQLEAKKPAQEVIVELVEEFKEQPKTRVHFEELQDARQVNSLELMWQDVLSSYEDREAHSAFIKSCKADGELDFALKMYGNILKHNPTDRIAKSFVAKMQVTAEVEGFVESEKSHRMLTRSFYITLAIVTAGLALICLGLVFGDDKNLAGLGIALIFFTFAVKAFFQPRRPSVG